MPHLIKRHTPMPSQRTGSTFFYGYVVVGLAFVTLMLTMGACYSFGIFFKPILTEFGWTRTMTSGAFSLATILGGIVAIPLGGLTDRFGPRAVMTVFGFLLGLGYLLMSQVNAIWHLYLVYGVIIGVSMAAPYVSQAPTVVRWFVKRRGLMTSIIIVGVSAGTIVIPLLVSRLISSYDWRFSFIILGGALMLLLVAAAQFMRHNPAQMGQRPYGEEELTDQQSEMESRSLSLGEAVRTRQLWLIAAILLCIGICLFVVMVHLVPHAIDLGIPEVTAANLLATIGALSIVGKLTMGYIIDRFGNKSALITGFVITSIAFVWLLGAKDMWSLYIFAAIFGFSYGGCLVPQPTLVAELFGLGSHGLILGITDFFVTLGAAIGPLMAGRIYDVTGSYDIAFVICVVFAVIGLLLTLLLRPVGGRHDSVGKESGI